MLEAPCSAGSGHVLSEGAGGRVWVFDTPRGAFRVLSKIRNPVWKKPDWAFVEEGKPIPGTPASGSSTESLGEYALYFGDGYMIHGTLYERLIGRPVSHGCIRVGREPLREIYRAVPLGAPGLHLLSHASILLPCTATLLTGLAGGRLRLPAERGRRRRRRGPALGREVERSAGASGSWRGRRAST